MLVSLYITEGPDLEPISLAEAKAHLRVDTSDDDAYIAALITAARQWVEQQANLCLITQEVEERFDAFPPYGYFSLAKSPAQSIDKIEYTDELGVLQTWDAANYEADVRMMPPRIMPRYGLTYPITRWQLSPIVVTYTAGYGDEAADVPEPLRHAIKLIVADMYENRENTPRPERQAAKMLIDNYRVQSF